MHYEYNRRKEKNILTTDELENMHLASFKPVLEIAFLALKTDYTASLVSDLAHIQSSVYSIQDLEQDLKKGIINIPLEIINSFEYPISEYIKNTELLNKEVNFLDWRKSIILKSRKRALHLLGLSYPLKTKKIVTALLNPIITDTAYTP